MTPFETFLLAVLGTISTLALNLAVLFTVIRSFRRQEEVHGTMNELRDGVNGRLTQLLDTTGRAEHSRGVLDGAAAAVAFHVADTVPTAGVEPS